MSPLRQKLVKVLGFGAVVIVVFYGLFTTIAHYNRMSYLPADIKAAGILYSKEENWGSILLALPGDNETGVVMYSLSDAQADEINSEGLKFFYLSENVEQRIGYKQQSFSQWYETPLADNDHRWAFTPGRKIANYLGKYGFGIDIDPSIVALVDDAISKPGSFYSYGRVGLVIIIPKAKRALVAYAG